MTHDTIIERWVDVLEGRRDGRGRPLRNYSASSNVWGDRDTLFSYGRHFPLVEYHPRTRRRRRPLFLLNGDRVSVTTSRHQSTARAVIGRRAQDIGADVLIVPFSALEGAGILRDTVVPLEIRPDRWDEWREPVPGEWDRIEWSGTRIQDNPGGRPGAIRETGTIPGNPDGSAVRYWRHYDYRTIGGGWVDDPGPVAHRYHDGSAVGWDEQHGWSVERRRHWLGDSLFTAETRHERRVERPVTVADVVRAAVRSIDARRHGYSGILDVVETLDNVDVETPIVETVTVRRRRRRRYVSSFDVNEPAPLYFLATLPSASRARTVAAAIDDLAPPAVHAAIARGRHVERQGDIFAIETDTHDAALAGYPRARLTLETRHARPRIGEPGYVAPFTAADHRRILERARELWRERWAIPDVAPVSPKGARRATARRVADSLRDLTAARARGRSAILAPFPTARVAGGYGPSFVAARYSIERARSAQAAARRRIRLESQHRGVQRDSYRHRSNVTGAGRALELWRDSIRRATLELRPGLAPDNVDRARRETRRILAIHGTAHTATEVVRAPGGRVYIRGAMIHAPALVGERRERDHVKRPLKPGVWYLAVRNTVPRASADTNGRR